MRLTKLQKQLCNILQKGLPVCSRPFSDIAEILSSDEKSVLQEVEALRRAGIIQRISARLNHRALGRAGTLVAAHIPEENLAEIAEAVNSLENVSHNYSREHYYNLWFTLQADSPGQIKVMVSNLSARFGVEFHSLPVKRIFKLDVRFDAEGEGQQLDDIEQVPSSEVIELNETEKRVLSRLQCDLEMTERPFDFLCDEELKAEEVLRIIKGLVAKGVVRRIAAAVDHRKLGFVANVMFCSGVSEDRVVKAGKRLARFGMVSHCYERETIENWPYNLFAMMHSKSMGEIQHLINRFVDSEQVASFELLPTREEFKKEPVKCRFD